VSKASATGGEGGADTVGGSRIVAIGSHVPEKVLTNADLEQMVDTTDEWIVSHTGIRERHIASDGEATSDLSIAAARRALEKCDIDPQQIGLVIVATVTPDEPFPATASFVQHALGLQRCAAFDVINGCTGFIYGLALASSLIRTRQEQYVLVIAAETLSKITDWQDRSTCVLFGDGAGAAVVGPAEPGTGILAVEWSTNGSAAHLLNLPAGGSRRPITHELIDQRQHYIKMQGHEVFKLAVRGIPEISLGALHKAGLTPQDVDLLVMHQANQRIIDAAAKRFDLPPEKVAVNVDRYGNTSAASIPIALAEAEQQGRLKPGDIVLMVGFGAGFSLGAAVVEW